MGRWIGNGEGRKKEREGKKKKVIFFPGKKNWDLYLRKFLFRQSQTNENQIHNIPQ